MQRITQQLHRPINGFLFISMFTLYHQIHPDENKTLFFTIKSGLEQLKLKLINYLKPTDEHAHIKALVRRGIERTPKETAVVRLRKARARTVLESELSQRYGNAYQTLTDNEIPTIGLCFAGGGYRAMIATIGYLQGLNHIGVLDACTYVAALSGSSWALAPWITSNEPSIDTFAYTFFNTITISSREGPVAEALKKTFTSNSLKDLLRFLRILITKKLYGQSVALVDYFGFTVSNPLLRDYHGKRFFEHRCSDMASYIADGSFPFPIFTCNEQPIGNATWFEYTPYEFGSHNYQAYIPVFSVGRTFINGQSIDFDPEQPLCYMLGISGSGYAYSIMAALPEVIERIARIMPYLLVLNKLKIIQELRHDIEEFKQQTLAGHVLTEFEEHKWGAGRINNPLYQMPHAANGDDKTIQLSDGGQVVFTVENHLVIGHNFASVPLLQPQRAVDVMIMCDADRHGVAGEHLRASVLYAHMQKGILRQFPPIDYHCLSKPGVHRFQDHQDANKPIILVTACIPDIGYLHGYTPADYDYTHTLNFAWMPDEVKRYSGLAHHHIAKQESADLIWQTIKEWVDAQRTHSMQNVYR